MTAPELAHRPVLQDSESGFLQRYGALFEHSPWVVARAWPARPFADAAALSAVFHRVLTEASESERLQLVRAHPALARRPVTPLSASSAAEQAGAGLQALEHSRAEEFEQLNRSYEQRFGFPFVLCVRRHDRTDIPDILRERLQRSAAQELDEALRQIEWIAHYRLADLVWDSP